MKFTSPLTRPLAVGLALLVVGCGAAPSTTPPARPRPLKTPQPAPAASVAPSQGAPAAAALVAASRAAFMAMPGYAFEMAFMQKKDRVVNGVYAIEGQPPRAMKIVIKEGGSVGTKLRWEGGDTIQVRAGGLLGAITVKLPLTDSRLVSVRGYTLQQTDMQSFYALMADPANSASVVGTTAGLTTLQVTGPKLLPGTEKMIVSFDAGTMLPKALAFSDAREVVFRMQIKNLRRQSNVSLEI